jgi:hypothetical protein
MIKLKLILLSMIIILTSGCTNLTLLASAGGVVVSHNNFVKAYNGLDFLTTVTTDKSIKKHIYDKHVQTLTRFPNN